MVNFVARAATLVALGVASSRSTIGFAKPRASVSSPGGGGGGGGSKPATDPIKDGSGGKRKASRNWKFIVSRLALRNLVALIYPRMHT